MKISDLNWRLIIVSAAGVAVVLNIMMLLLAIFFSYTRFFPDSHIGSIENYLIIMGFFSPLVASLVSCGIVAYRSSGRKLLHTMCSTVITFSLTLLILVFITIEIGRKLTEQGFY